jgi:hypothetical protein
MYGTIMIGTVAARRQAEVLEYPDEHRACPATNPIEGSPYLRPSEP